jgi:nicotinate-nucleotide pyrophosphorylase (carboxylating)
MDITSMDLSEIDRVVAAALAEDVGTGDITSATVIPAGTTFKGVMAAREDMVVAGLPIARRVFELVVPQARFESKVKEGDWVAAQTILAEITGPAQGLLEAERTALNLLQMLSGIATLTRRYKDRITGMDCLLLDTRKTVPGLRVLSKYAAKLGGATNHRMGLWDAILIKDNHIAVCGGVEIAVKRALKAAYAPIEVECDTLSQVAEAVAAGAHVILLDNMSLDQLRQSVALVGKRAKTEASGGVTLETIRAIAETGVDRISVGRITQSAPAMDIGLDWGVTGHD